MCVYAHPALNVFCIVRVRERRFMIRSHIRTIAVILLILPFAIFSQAAESAEAGAARMKDRLLLTAEQAAQVRNILRTEEAQKMRDEREFRSRRDRLKASLRRMAQSDTDIEKILTPEQKKRFDHYKEERGLEMRERMKERQP